MYLLVSELYGNEISAFVESDKFLISLTTLDFIQRHYFMETVLNTYDLQSVEKLSVPVRRCLSLSKHVNQTARLSHTAPNNL